MVDRSPPSRSDAPAAVVDPPTVSVVVPVWNVEPYLRQCLDSVVGQTIGLDRLEVVTVDHGSTDGSADLLDAYAARYTQVVVVRAPHEGGPGRPRNLGLERATGTYVFFLDADDYLGAEALARLVAMAERNGTDVVLGKMVGFDGRHVPTRAFRRTRERADPEDVFSTLAVLKLFRRSLIERLGLRFDETLAAHEDGLFTTIAYLEAGGISVVADYACYYVRRGNHRGRFVDPLDFLNAIGRRIEAVEVRQPPGAVRDLLMRRHISDVLRAYTSLWTKLEPERRRQVFELGAQFIERWRASARSLDDLSPAQALRLYCLEHGLQPELEEIVDTPDEAATRDAIVEGGRRYARFPHFRDEAGIPDRIFEMGRKRFTRARLAHRVMSIVAAMDRRRARLMVRLHASR